jgi:hypothetical protein
MVLYFSHHQNIDRVDKSVNAAAQSARCAGVITPETTPLLRGDSCQGDRTILHEAYNNPKFQHCHCWARSTACGLEHPSHRGFIPLHTPGRISQHRVTSKLFPYKDTSTPRHIVNAIRPLNLNSSTEIQAPSYCNAKMVSHGISLQVTVHIDPKNTTEFFQHFKPLYDQVIAEPELRFFEVYQSAEDPGTISWVEHWFVLPLFSPLLTRPSNAWGLTDHQGLHKGVAFQGPAEQAVLQGLPSQGGSFIVEAEGCDRGESGGAAVLGVEG